MTVTKQDFGFDSEAWLNWWKTEDQSKKSVKGVSARAL